MYHCIECEEDKAQLSNVLEVLKELGETNWIVVDDRLGGSHTPHDRTKRKLDGIMILGDNQIAPYIDCLRQSVNPLRFKYGKLHICKQCISGFFDKDRVADMNLRVKNKAKQVKLIIIRELQDDGKYRLRYFEPEII